MMDLTPLEVRKKKGDFRRGIRGYDPPQVDDFLDIVADRLEAVVRENQGFNDRLARLEQQVTDYREREKALTEALVTAQEMREEMRAQSTREAELARRQAEQDAKGILAEAQHARDREEDTLRRLRGRQLQFLQTYRRFLERELGELASIANELELDGAMTDPLAAPPVAFPPPAEPIYPAAAEPAATAPPQPAASALAPTPPVPSAPARPATPPASPPAGAAKETAAAPAAARPTAPTAARPAAPAAARPTAPAAARPTAPAAARPAAPAAARPAAPAAARPAAPAARPAAPAPATPASRPPERTAFAAGVAGAGVRAHSPPRAEPIAPPMPPTPSPAPPADVGWATEAPAEVEAELILSDEDVLPESELTGATEAETATSAGSASRPDTEPYFAEFATPPQASGRPVEGPDPSFGQELLMPDIVLPEPKPQPPKPPASPPDSPPSTSNNLGLDLVPEFQSFHDFGDLDSLGGLDDSEFGLPDVAPQQTAGGAEAEPKRRDDSDDDPEDLLSSLFRDDR